MNPRSVIPTMVLALLLGAGWSLGAGCGRGAGRTAHEAEDPSHAEAEAHGHEEEGEHREVELSPEAVANARLRLAAAGPASIAIVAEAPGEVHLDAERVLEVRPRYAGVVREIRKRVGETVRAGEVVAVVQSNESLADYEIVSSLDGTVIARPVVAGQAVDVSTALLTIADLTSVWVDFAIYPQHAGRIRAGMEASIVAHHRPALVARGTVSYVGPLLEQDTRVSSARVVLRDPRGEWQPGLFVTASVVLERARVAVAVPDAAVVRTAEGPAVFVAHGTRFSLTPVTLGRSDGTTTEVRSGLAAGDTVVVENAFLLKSELGKGEAGHEH